MTAFTLVVITSIFVNQTIKCFLGFELNFSLPSQPPPTTIRNPNAPDANLPLMPSGADRRQESHPLVRRILGDREVL